MRQAKMKAFLSTRRRSSVVFLLAILYFFVLTAPYYVWGHVPPVGWDTPWYIYNMRLLAEQGPYSLFEKTPGINLYSVFGYVISSVFRISFVDIEKFLPIILATSFSLVNYKVIKRMTKSWKLSLLAMVFTIFDWNILRLATDLHRNLFSFLLVEIALFLLLPDILEQSSKKKVTAFSILLTVSGLAHLETFALATLVLFILFLFYLKWRLFQEAKILLLCILLSSLLVIVFEIPFILRYLEGHPLLNASQSSAPRFAYPWDYFISLGVALIPFYVVGLHMSFSAFQGKSEKSFLALPLWNLVLIAGSFLPFLITTVPGARFLFLVTIPPLATIGYTKVCTKKSLKFKTAVLLIVTLSAVILRIAYLSTSYLPWISKDNYEKLLWINDDKQDKPYIFVLYFDKTQWTSGFAELNRHWVWALSGTRANFYFGKVENLLNNEPTRSDIDYINSTSYYFWNELENLTLKNARIYIIAEWYEAPINPDNFNLDPTSFDLTYIKEQGVYRIDLHQE